MALQYNVAGALPWPWSWLRLLMSPPAMPAHPPSIEGVINGSYSAAAPADASSHGTAAVSIGGAKPAAAAAANGSSKAAVAAAVKGSSAGGAAAAAPAAGSWWQALLRGGAAGAAAGAAKASSKGKRKAQVDVSGAHKALKAQQPLVTVAA
jgi:hypothetical protein